MMSRISRGALLGVLATVGTLALAPNSAYATPITYTLTGTGAFGEINGTLFDNQLMTITAIGDTDTLADRSIGWGIFPSINLTSLTFQIGANPAAVATVPANYYLYNLNSASPNYLGISNQDYSEVLVWESSSTGSWDFVSDFTDPTNTQFTNGAFSTN